MGRRAPFAFPPRIPAADDIRQSVERSLRKLPRLARLNPKAALVVERNIDDWMPESPSGDRAPADRPTLHAVVKPRLARRVFAHPAIATSGRRKAAS